jgi:hypothetical protein
VPLALIGYFPKRLTPRPAGIDAPHVREICSVSSCLAQAPEGWIQHWTHNELWLYGTTAAAWAVVDPAERTAFALYAYRLLPRLFHAQGEDPLPLPALDVAPLPRAFSSLGFDAVARSSGTSFECSPLSCNNMARETPVNEFCLAASLPEAIGLARRFAAGGVEPGPYCVVEVVRGRAEKVAA